MPLEKNHFYRFGSFRLDPAKCLLLRGQKTVPLMPKAFDTLLVLVENHDRMVGKEELMKVLWPDSFVEEANLAQNVAVLRKALGDSPEEHRYILTIPGRGYRFSAEVNEEAEDEDTELVVERHSCSRVMVEESTFPKPGSAILVTPSTLLKRTRNRILGVVAMAAVALIGATFVSNVAKRRDRLLGLLRLTSPSAASAISPVRARHSIAVLPLEDLSGDTQQDYFAEGMTDELTTDLAQLEDLRVISRTSAMHYKGTNKTSLQIGKELGVDTLIEGTVERVGEHVRIRAQLIDCISDRHLWAKGYDREFKDVLALESELARDIVEQTQGNVLSTQTLTRPADSRPVSPEAYDDYLKGRYVYIRHNPAEFEKAIAYFQRAIEKSPDFALAYSELADAYILLANFDLARPESVISKARASAEKALSLDDSLAEPHTSLAIIAQNYDWNWSEAESHYRQAIRLNPSYATAHHWYGEGYLTIMGRFDDALAEIRLAQRLDPLSLSIATDIGKVLLLARRYDEAVQQFRNILEIDTRVATAHNLLGWSYLMTGRYDQALIEMTAARQLLDVPGFLADLGVLYAKTGQKNKAQNVLRQLKKRSEHGYVPEVDFAEIYNALGQKDEAFQAFEEALKERSLAVVGLKIDPQYASLHPDPRYVDLVRRMGLEP